MLNSIPKPFHFLDYLNFGSLIFPLVNLLELMQLSSIGNMLVNIELAKFV